MPTGRRSSLRPRERRCRPRRGSRPRSADRPPAGTPARDAERSTDATQSRSRTERSCFRYAWTACVRAVRSSFVRWRSIRCSSSRGRRCARIRPIRWGVGLPVSMLLAQDELDRRDPTLRKVLQGCVVEQDAMPIEMVREMASGQECGSVSERPPSTFDLTRRSALWRPKPQSVNRDPRRGAWQAASAPGSGLPTRRSARHPRSSCRHPALR